MDQSRATRAADRSGTQPPIAAALSRRLATPGYAEALLAPLALRQLQGGPHWQALVAELIPHAPDVLGVLKDLGISDDAGDARSGDAREDGSR